MAFSGEVKSTAYDQLVLATGSKPWLPPVPGLSLDVTCLHPVFSGMCLGMYLRLMSCLVTSMPTLCPRGAWCACLPDDR